MKATAKAGRRFILPATKVGKANEILPAKTAAETAERALNILIADVKIRKMLLSAKDRTNL
jgi:hypothetical protein